MIQKTRWSIIRQIFWSFFKIGPVTFGGGYAIIPVIEKEVIEKQRWVKEKEAAEIFTISGSIPGAIGVNSATFIGYKLAGIRGAIAALIGIMLPTFIIVIILAMAYLYLKENPKISAAFEGIRPAIVALIFYAGIRMSKSAIQDKTTFATVVITVLLLFLLQNTIHPVFIILSGGAAGIILVRLKQKLGYSVQLEEESSPYKYPDYFIGDGI